jgi:hypothetical protein
MIFRYSFFIYCLTILYISLFEISYFCFFRRFILVFNDSFSVIVFFSDFFFSLFRCEEVLARKR